MNIDSRTDACVCYEYYVTLRVEEERLIQAGDHWKHIRGHAVRQHGLTMRS